MKKVLLMNLTPRWGMLHYASQFSNALEKRNDIQQMVAIASYDNWELYHTKNFIQIRTNPNFWSCIIDTLNVLYHIVFLYKILRFRPDIVHFLDNHPWYIVYWRLLRLLGYTIYTTQHDPTLHSGDNVWLQWKLAGYTNHILRQVSHKIMVHGDVLAKQMLEIYDIPKEKVLSIRHWAYTFFNSWKQDLEIKKDNFLFFWRVLDYKWLDVLLQSLEKVGEEFPEFTLTIAWPWDLSPYKKMLDKHSTNVEIYNTEIEAQDVYKYFEKAEFIVLPYRDATGSWVVPIAYCFSKPVIVTDVWELPSVVRDGETWYVIKPWDCEALGATIIQLLEDKNKTKKMWEKAFKFSEKELWWADIIDQIYEK